MLCFKQNLPETILPRRFLLLALTAINCSIHNASAQTPSGNAKIIGPDTAIVGQEIEISIELKNSDQVNSYNVDLQYPKVVDFKSVSGANGNPTPNVRTEIIRKEKVCVDFPKTLLFSTSYLGNPIPTQVLISTQYTEFYKG